MLSATQIESLIREAASPANATCKIIELLDAEVGFERDGMNPQNWERIIAGTMTGMVFDGLQLKLRELEELAREVGVEEWIRHAREFDRDRCIATIEHVAGPGRLRLAREAVELAQRDFKVASQS